MADGKDTETAFNDAAKLIKQGKMAQEKSMVRAVPYGKLTAGNAFLCGANHN